MDIQILWNKALLLDLRGKILLFLAISFVVAVRRSGGFPFIFLNMPRGAECVPSLIVVILASCGCMCARA